jgi:polyisoprenoid-binding protein YceI
MAMPTHTLDGIDPAAAGPWVIDPVHADVGFVGRHFGLNRLRDSSTGLEGVVELARSRHAD